MSLQVVDVDAPETAGDKIQENPSNVVPEPPLSRMREAPPPVSRNERPQDNVIEPIGLRHKLAQISLLHSLTPSSRALQVPARLFFGTQEENPGKEVKLDTIQR